MPTRRVVVYRTELALLSFALAVGRGRRTVAGPIELPARRAARVRAQRLPERASSVRCPLARLQGRGGRRVPRQRRASARPRTARCRARRELRDALPRTVASARCALWNAHGRRAAVSAHAGNQGGRRARRSTRSWRSSRAIRICSRGAVGRRLRPGTARHPYRRSSWAGIHRDLRTAFPFRCRDKRGCNAPTGLPADAADRAVGLISLDYAETIGRRWATPSAAATLAVGDSRDQSRVSRATNPGVPRASERAHIPRASGGWSRPDRHARTRRDRAAARRRHESRQVVTRAPGTSPAPWFRARARSPREARRDDSTRCVERS